jgi:hypothetical protein
LRRDYGAAQTFVIPADFQALAPISGDLLPEFCHDLGMGQLLSLRRSLVGPDHASPFVPLGKRPDPAKAARGVLLALAVSTLAWIALALAVPRLW